MCFYADVFFSIFIFILFFVKKILARHENVGLRQAQFLKV